MSDQPLKGMRVLITRAKHQAEETADRLNALGADVICLPMIEISAPQSWEPFDKAVKKLGQYDWVVFASANAVDSFFGRLAQVKKRARKFPKFATIGPKTTMTLAGYGHGASYQAEAFVAESFVENFPVEEKLKVLWPKTDIGRTLIADELTRRGAKVDVVHCYQTTLPEDAHRIGERLCELLYKNKLDVITLASSQTAKNMRQILNMTAQSEKDIIALLAPVKVVAIGPETARAAAENLRKLDAQADEFTVDGIIQALMALRIP